MAGRIIRANERDVRRYVDRRPVVRSKSIKRPPRIRPPRFEIPEGVAPATKGPGDPESLVLLGQLNDSRFEAGLLLAWDGDSVVISGGSSTSVPHMSYVTLADPTSPSVDGYTSQTEVSVTRGGKMRRAGDYVVTVPHAAASASLRLIIWNLSTPTSPALVGYSAGGHGINASSRLAVHPGGQFAYVCAGDNLLCFDISNPAVPTQVSATAVSASWANSLVTSEDEADVIYAWGALGMYRIDVSTPASPVVGTPVAKSSGGSGTQTEALNPAGVGLLGVQSSTSAGGIHLWTPGNPLVAVTSANNSAYDSMGGADNGGIYVYSAGTQDGVPALAVARALSPSLAILRFYPTGLAAAADWVAVTDNYVVVKTDNTIQVWGNP